MKTLAAALLFLGLSQVILSAQQSHVILCGGPALRKWEDLRVEPDQHDRWWANFVRASTMRMDEINKAYGTEANIIWMVYKPGYITRGKEAGKPYTTWITEQASKRGARLIWLNSGSEFFSRMNALPRGSVTNFDFFGHSNKHCFLLDYSNEIMASCKAWIHETELSKLRSSIFSKHALCQSWGCHTGESMSAHWKRATGISMIGAKGKTDYSALSFGRMPKVNGSWVR